ncbi:MAG: nucleotidyltransferase family protein, partial [Planctomycetales bacterium]|nr:nucleotidyltransferase family protein [Planctomycetales bacterium]
RGLVFKGPALAADAYGDVTLRECGDLDLLISHAEFPRVEEALKQEGFTSNWEDPGQTRQVFACEFNRADASLDVHWDLAPGWFNYRVDFDRFWNDAVALPGGSGMLRKPPAEDSLSVLCIHGSKHWWDRLRWVCDVAELINAQQVVDWDRVEHTAKATHCRRTVAVGVYLAHAVLGAKLPAEVLTKLNRTSGVQRLSAQVDRWLDFAEQSKAQRNTRDRFWFRMGACERLRDRVPQIIHYLRARGRVAN